MLKIVGTATIAALFAMASAALAQSTDKEKSATGSSAGGSTASKCLGMPAGPERDTCLKDEKVTSGGSASSSTSGGASSGGTSASPSATPSPSPSTGASGSSSGSSSEPKK